MVENGQIKIIIEMSKYMGIHIKTTAAGSPGVAVELDAIIKHSTILVIKLINKIINQIINKIISDTHCSLEIALS